MSIEERVRALLESLQAGRVCVEVDDVAGDEPTTISASVEMLDGSTWVVLDRVPRGEDAAKSVAKIVQGEMRDARVRSRQDLIAATRNAKLADRMESALAREGLLRP